MPTTSIVPALVEALLDNDTVTDLVDVRICAEGGVLQDEAPNYVTVDETDNDEEQDLEGPTGDCFAEVKITATSTNRDDCNAIAHAVAGALRDLAGTFAGVVIVDTLVRSVSQAPPPGPVDQDEAEPYQSEVTAQIEYEGA